MDKINLPGQLIKLANTRFWRWKALACERLQGEAPRFSLDPSHLANWDFWIQRMLASAHPETNGKTALCTERGESAQGAQLRITALGLKLNNKPMVLTKN